MKSLSLAAAVSILATPCVALAQDAGPVQLKSKLTPGKTYKYRTDMDMSTDSPLGGDEKMSTKMSMDMGMAVAEAEGDNKLVTTKFDRVRMEMNMAGQAMVYDSTDKTKQSPLLKTAFAGIADKEFKAVYDKNNKFVKMEGDGGAAGALGGMGINKDQVEQMLTQLTDYGFPERELKPGEKWDHTQAANMGQMGKMEIDMQFTYKGMTDHEGHKVAEIDYTGSVGGEAGAEGALVSFKDSKLYGKMYFDPELGAVRKSTMQMDMTMVAGGAELDTSTTSTQTLLSVE